MSKLWTAKENAELRLLASRHFNTHAIAQQLGRTYMSVSCHARDIGVDIEREDRHSDEGPSVNWKAMCWERLSHCYGPDRADRIMSGQDPKTQADIRAWNQLGRRSAA